MKYQKQNFYMTKIILSDKICFAFWKIISSHTRIMRVYIELFRSLVGVRVQSLVKVL